jgi:TonB family protein
MRICNLTAIFALFVVFPNVARLQEQTVPTSTQASAYPNTTEGLKRLLQDMRATARENNEQKLAAYLKTMEVPNCYAWLHEMYETDKADSWMSLCDPKTLAYKEKFLLDRFVSLAGESGEISVRRVNDNPEPGKGLEWGWLHAIRHPLDIYFAGWKTASQPTEARDQPLGYFVFVDGAFRWDSLVEYLVPAKLIKKVEPVYPTSASSQRIAGKVRVRLVIAADGSVQRAHAISGEGYSDDPSLIRAAEEAAMKWRYQPATLLGRAIQTNTTVDVAFAPQN